MEPPTNVRKVGTASHAAGRTGTSATHAVPEVPLHPQSTSIPSSSSSTDPSETTDWKMREILCPLRPGRAAYVYDSPLVTVLADVLGYTSAPVDVSLRLRPVLDARRSDGLAPLGGDAAPTAGPVFNPPMVHTFDPATALPYADPFERHCLESIINFDVFVQRVLRGTPPSSTLRGGQTRMRAEWVKELHKVGYLRQPDAASPEPWALCPVSQEIFHYFVPT
jgi:hypothetical protein